jgi:hypothetical protein
VDTVDALEKEPMDKAEREDQTGLHDQPEPSPENGPGDYSEADRCHSRVTSQTQERVWKAKGVALIRSNNAAAGQDRVKTTIQLGIGIFQQTDFILTEREGAKDTNEPDGNQDIGQNFLQV